MATRPGVLTDWRPWKPLGNFKYAIILTPWVVHSTYSFVTKGEKADLFYFLIFPFLMTRVLHNQIWISLPRYRIAKGNNRMGDKGIDFEQVDKESDWDDHMIIIISGIVLYLRNMILPGTSNLLLWRTDGVIITILVHMGPVQFLYFWFYRPLLHQNYLYSARHQIWFYLAAIIPPFAEVVVLFYLLFSIPLMAMAFTGTASIVAVFGYLTYIDLMNNVGHYCNFELVPKWVFSTFPPLKYLTYTPSYHSLHHAQFPINYSLLMPTYDYMFETVDKSRDLCHPPSPSKSD